MMVDWEERTLGDVKVSGVVFICVGSIFRVYGRLGFIEIEIEWWVRLCSRPLKMIVNK